MCRWTNFARHVFVCLRPAVSWNESGNHNMNVIYWQNIFYSFIYFYPILIVSQTCSVVTLAAKALAKNKM